MQKYYDKKLTGLLAKGEAMGQKDDKVGDKLIARFTSFIYE